MSVNLCLKRCSTDSSHVPQPLVSSAMNIAGALSCCHRCRYYVLRNNVVEKVLRLLYRREKWLVVAAVRFLRTCIGLKDDFYNRYLVGHLKRASPGILFFASFLL